MVSGAYHVARVCTRCRERLAPGWVGKAELIKCGIDPDALPIVEDYRTLAPACEVRDCDEVGSEDHHWAPRKYWGDECEKWPRSNLCRKHHMEWHSMLTKNRTVRP